MNQKENIIPEARNLYSALRNSGYSNTAAIGDLIDNSLDAGAKTIKIDIAEDLKQIYISDDGTGMSIETLKLALRLGGRKVHDNINDLGKYGLGLITASLSMGTRLRVITRKDGVTNVGIFDYDEVYSSNGFIASFREATNSEILGFNYRTNNAKSGTVLSIENCDKIQYNDLASFESDLRSTIKSTFWAFVQNEREIIVNNKVVPTDDPLYRFDSRTKTYLNKSVKVPLNNNETGKLDIFAVEVPDFGTKLNRQLHINIVNQGFYFLRNNREIASAQEILEIFKKHNDYNRLRIILNFGPELDEEMGVNYTKHNVAPSKKIISILKRELDETVKEVRKEAKLKQAENKEKKKGEGDSNPFVKQPDNDAAETNDAEQQTTNTAEKPEIKEVKLMTVFTGKENDSLVKFEVAKGKAKVSYNGDNKFYRDKINEEKDGAELKKKLDIILKAVLEATIKNNIPTETISKLGKDISSALEESEE